MTDNLLARLYEHNNWANLELIKACSALSDEQLDGEPQSVTKGSLRLTLTHLVEAQVRYLAQLTGKELSHTWEAPPPFAELEQATHISGEGLLALVRAEANMSLKADIQKDGYAITPWVVMLQAINHATEHREQIKSMLSTLGVTPPRIDGWAYGRATDALRQIEK